MEGERFGKLVVLEVFTKQFTKRKIRVARCQCDCGEIVDVRLSRVRDQKGCRCVCRNKKGPPSLRMKFPRIAMSLSNIKKRCFNKKDPEYKNYGGRGITLCDEWRNSTKGFIEWSLENGYKENLQIDRINNDGDYEPSNCRWVTPKENSRNKRDNIFVTAFGETKCLLDWSRDYRSRVKQNSIKDRISRGWSPEEAISKPPKIYKKKS